MSPPDVGDRAPDFELPDQSGRPVRLSSFRGRRVVLTFYAEDFTPVCDEQVCGLRDRWRDFADAGVEVLAVSPDPVASHARYAAEKRLPFSILSDPARKVMLRWGAWGEKSMYGRKVEGILRSTYVIGPDGRVEHAFRRIRTPGHAKRVLDAIRAEAKEA